MLNARKVFPFLMILAGLLLAAWLLPRGAALYQQVRGGLLLEQALADLPEAQRAELPCAADPLSEAQARQQAEEAASLLARAAAYPEAPAQAALLLGRAECWLGRYDQAVLAYQAYVARHPQNQAGLLEWGLALQRQAWERTGEPDGYLADLDAGELPGIQALAAQHPEILQAWQRAQLSAAYFVEAGAKAFRAQQYPQALAWYERALWLDARHTPAWLGAAQTCEAQGRSTEALQAYQIAWEIDASLAALPLAQALSTYGSSLEAIATLRSALQQFPQAAERLEWWVYLGQKLAEGKDWAAAGEMLAEALAEFPADPSLRIQQGWVYYERDGDAAAARQAFEQAIQIAPGRGDGYYAIGQLLVRQQLHAQADPWFEQAIQASPTRQQYYLSRANAARNAGNLTFALQIYQQTVELFPNFAYAYYDMAQAYYLNEQPQEAVAAIEQALALRRPPEVLFYLRAGLIYEWAGQPEQAREAYRQALLLDADNQTAQDALARLGGQE